MSEARPPLDAPLPGPARDRAIPALFVVLWSTGFISAKFGLPYAGPLTYLLLRFLVVAAVMAAAAVALRAAWPREPARYAHLAVAGLLIQATYLGGVFVAIARGMPAGTSAMLVGLQPVLTVCLAAIWLRERVVARQWAGLGLGVAGVWLVVRHKVALDALDPVGFAASAAALVGISVGTLYQKRFCGAVDLRVQSAVQFGVCAGAFAAAGAFLEPRLAPGRTFLDVSWTWQFQFALAWSVLPLSVGAISLLYWLLRHGAAASVARLFYLVPAVTAGLAYLLFDEALTSAAVAGMVLIAAAVILARPRPAA